MEVEVAHPSQPNASRFDEPAAAAMSLPQPPAPQQRSGNTRSGHTSLQQKRPAPVDGSKILRNDEVYRQLFEAQVQLTDQLAGTRWWRENKPAVKQVKSSRDLSLPVVRNAAPATSRGMLAGRQADWTRALENDGRTENPVVARQTAEWLDLVSAETESGQHATEVADLPDQVRPSKLRSDVIDRIKEKRRERHNLTLEEMHQELYQVGVTFEPLIVQRCQSLHETLAKLEEELDRRLSPLATNESLMALDQHQLLGLWQGVAEVFADRRNAIGSLDEDLLALESDRVTEIRRVFPGTTARSWNASATWRQPSCTGSWTTSCADEPDPAGQPAQLRGPQRSIGHVRAGQRAPDARPGQDKITEWRAGHVEVAVAGFHQFVQSPQVQSPPSLESILSNMRAEQSEINSRRLELIEELSSLAPPN
uniref:Type III effector protein XopP n=1 Tax=Macrostomum lignano TaxID=282301 RepID=A0A1I8GEI3_9PLAT